MKLKAEECLTKELAEGALAASFGFTSDADKSMIDADVTCEGRRLSSDGNERRLAAHATKESVISYTIYVPESMDHNDIVAKVKQLNEPGASQDAFVKHIKDEGGIEVDATSIEASVPTVTSVVITVNDDGSLAEKPVPVDKIPTKSSPVPAAKSEEGSNVGAIIGGIIGGLVALALIGGLAYYFLVVKKRSES